MMISSTHIYIIAGESSGDQIGGYLMKALHQKENIRISGIGGPYMNAQGLKSLFPMSELSIMGIIEILPHIPRVLRRLQETKRDILKKKPDVVVTIDSPGFNFRLAKQLKHHDIPVIHYTAPTVWAWRPKRAKKIAKFLKHLLVLFPFEPPYFEKERLPTTFVGHPLIEMDISPQHTEEFCQRYDFKSDQSLLCLLPGSRRSEIDRLLPIFIETLSLLKLKYPTLAIVMPVVPHLETYIRDYLNKRSVRVTLITDSQEKISAMAASTVALAASGTVSLELALTETPMVIAYKINSFTAFLIKRLILTSYVCLVNILLQKKIVPELIQKNCTPKKIVHALEEVMLNDPKEELKKIRSLLSIPSLKPSELAADIIIEVINKEKKIA